MEKYVQHLLKDINKKIKNGSHSLPSTITSRSSGVDQPTPSLESALKDATFQTLEERLNISKTAFPEAERLSNIQIKQILAAFTQLLEAFGLGLNFPKETPSVLRYEVLIVQLEKEVPILPHHQWQLALCGYNPKSCSFGSSYCQCKSWEEILFEFPELNLDDEEEGLIFVK